MQIKLESLQVESSNQPNIEVITGRCYIKKAVRAMMTNMETFMRNNTVGQYPNTQLIGRLLNIAKYKMYTICILYLCRGDLHSG